MSSTYDSFTLLHVARLNKRSATNKMTILFILDRGKSVVKDMTALADLAIAKDDDLVNRCRMHTRMHYMEWHGKWQLMEMKGSSKSERNGMLCNEEE